MRKRQRPLNRRGRYAFAVWRSLGLIAIAWGAGALALRVVVVPTEHCPALTPAEAEAAALEAAEWVDRVQSADGSYLYEFDIERDVEVPGYNEVRHAGVTMSLYQLAAEGHSEELVTADLGLDWMIANLIERDDWAALQGPGGGRVALGSSALMLAALTQRRIATDDRSYDDLMRRVARFLVVQQQADGSFLEGWSVVTEAPIPGVRSKYATGEAFWALTLMHRLFPREGWDWPARLVADYLAVHRDTVERQKFPPWADQWAAYGLSEMATWGLSEPQVAYARSLSERFGLLVRAESQRTESRFSKLIHGRRARAAGMGTWVEALGSLWRLSLVEPRLADLEPKLRERLGCGAGMLRERQVPPERAIAFASPHVARGAWFTEGKTRMDDQQHALSGLIRARAALVPAVKE